MRKLAKLLSLVLATLMVVSVFVTNTSAAFSDVSAKNEELYEAVTLLNSLGIAKGTSETTFGVKENVTREQMAAFIYRMMKKGKSSEGGENLTSFTDLKDPTFYSMISWASSLGIIKGTSETTFNPKGGITLQDCYVMLVRTLGYEKDEQLVYPFGYINIAEKIGLHKNITKSYDATLTRGDVALILYNAFYADMNETYDDQQLATYDGLTSVIEVTVNESISHKIYGVEKIVRRIVATPSYALDLSALSKAAGDEYAKTAGIAPLYDSKNDIVLVQTAAVVPEQDSARHPKEKELIEFEDLGLAGEADDYFLKDVTIYIDGDGKIWGSTAVGINVEGANVKTNLRSGTYKNIDLYGGSDTEKPFYTGLVNVGEDKAYFYAKPEACPEYAVSICPVDGDGEGRMTFKAGYTWYGELCHRYNTSSQYYNYLNVDFDFYDPPTNAQGGAQNVIKANHDELENILGVLGHKNGGGKATTKYFDSNDDSYIDYLWVMPYTFGEITNLKGDANTVDARHTGDSSYMAAFNSSKKIPAIYIADAYIEGDNYTEGEYCFAYVAGPAKYIKIGSEDLNNSVKYTTATLTQISGGNRYQFDDGTVVNSWNSGTFVVGHVNYSASGPTKILGPSYYTSAFGTYNSGSDGSFASEWRKCIDLGDTWELIVCSNRLIIGWPVDKSTDLANNYAVVQYVNEDNQQVVFEAGGIEMDGTLEATSYVQAYINGKLEVVKAAKNITVSDNKILQDDSYFINGTNGTPIVGNVSYYEVNSDGEYSFYEVEANTPATNLTNPQDSSLVYIAKNVSDFTLSHYMDGYYRFVPQVNWDVLDPALTPNGLRNVVLDENTKIIIKYYSEGTAKYEVFDSGNLPNFDTTSIDMAFDNAVVVLQNNPDSTTTEKLAFMYAEVGAEIIYEETVEKSFVVLVGKSQKLDEENEVYNEYTAYNPLNGELLTLKTSREPAANLQLGTLYRLTDEGLILDTSAGLMASLNAGSTAIKDLSEYMGQANLLEVVGGTEPVTVDENTAVAVYNRDKMTLKMDTLEALEVKHDDALAEEYYDSGDSSMNLLIVSETVKGEDFEHAKSIIIVING